MGVKSVTSWLNEHGYRTRVGARWGIGPLHQILTRATYKREHRFNRKVWKTKEAKPEADQIGVPVDPIIDAPCDLRKAGQKDRSGDNPRSGMTLRTGKSGRYRYYTCATCAQQGKAACKGRSIPMDKLDRLITARLADRLLTPERVGKLLAGLMKRLWRRFAAIDNVIAIKIAPDGSAGIGCLGKRWLGKGWLGKRRQSRRRPRKRTIPPALRRCAPSLPTRKSASAGFMPPSRKA